MQQSTSHIPNHVALIMDGNGRWAEGKGAPRAFGHRVGTEVARKVVAHAAKRGVRYLSLYAFSSDNWKRPASEVALLMRLLESHLRSEVRELVREGVRLEVIGRRDRLDPRLLRAILHAESATDHGERMTLRIAIDYSSRHEIARRFTASVPSQMGVDVDLLIRTGGDQRLSDFLLWEAAYAELVFTPTCWPAFTTEELDRHLADFAHRERRFGALPGRATA